MGSVRVRNVIKHFHYNNIFQKRRFLANVEELHVSVSLIRYTGVTGRYSLLTRCTNSCRFSHKGIMKFIINSDGI
jgi:hypothetical protein